MTKIKEEIKLNTAVEILNQIPEFNENFEKAEIQKRLQKTPVILVAYHNNIPAGCKIGYDRFENKTYYSWLGGVLPQFRQQKIAHSSWARKWKNLQKPKDSNIFN